MGVKVSDSYKMFDNVQPNTRLCAPALDVKTVNAYTSSDFLLLEDSRLCKKKGKVIEGHTKFTKHSLETNHINCLRQAYSTYTVCSESNGALLIPRAVSLLPTLPIKNFQPYAVPKQESTKEDHEKEVGLNGVDSTSEKYTVYIITFDRDEMLKKTIKNYAQSKLVDKIIVSWNNIQRLPPPTLHKYAGVVPLYIVEESIDTLNNRFKPRSKLINTRAVFNVDDDILIPYPEVDFAFRAWQHFPNTIVGFSQYVRSHSYHTSFGACSKSGNNKKWHYSVECTSKDGKSYYGFSKFPVFSIALDSAIFFHSKYLDLYWEDNIEMREARKLVDDTRNCEDFVLPVLIAIKSQEPPVMVDTYDLMQRFSSVVHMQAENKKGHHPGLNTMPGHYEKRSYCLRKLDNIFGGLPLQYTVFKMKPLLPTDVI